MKKQTKTTKTVKQESTKAKVQAEAPAPVNSLPVPEIHIQTGRDLKNAVLIVSLVLNLFMLVGWLVLQATPDYNAAVAGFLFR